MSDSTAESGEGWVRACGLEDVAPGSLKSVETDRERIVVANVDGDLYALEDQCSHQDFPLSAGVLEGNQVECVFHGARFELASGRPTCLPAVRPVRTFDIRVEGEDVYVRVG